MKNFLITGLPGIGKTSLVIKLADLLKEARPAGFYTREIREEGIRKGFELVDFNGERSIISHIGLKSPFTVGKYGVDVETFDAYLKKADFLSSEADIVVIDEIGRMECFSKFFRDVILQLLDSDKIFVATIALRGDHFIDQIKARKDVGLFVALRDNMDELAQTLSSRILKAVSASEGD
jgi:nucleoside-triphosphatase